MDISRIVSLADHYAAWIAAGSVLMLIAGALAVPWLVCQLPGDYFLPEHRERLPRRGPVPTIYWPWIILRNLIGALLIVLGVVMLVTPGQGILTLLAGLWLTNFPGKYRLERRLIALPGVLKAINWIRRRRGLAPMAAPELTPGWSEH